MMTHRHDHTTDKGTVHRLYSYYTTPKEEHGDHIRMIYSCDDPGIYPYINFHHVVYYVTLRNAAGPSMRVASAEKTLYDHALLP